MFDLRGFGYSGGNRRNCRMKDFLEDLHLVIKQCFPDLPLFLYGHSLGGFIALNYLILNKINISGVMFTNPFIDVPNSWKITPFKNFLMKMLGPLMEETVLNSSVNPTTLTKDNFTVTKINYFFKNDIHVGFGLIQDFLHQSKIVKQNLEKFRFPCLLIQGMDDAVVDPASIISIFRNLHAKDKNIKLIEGGFHELYADKEKGAIASMMVDWILDRIDDRALLLG